MMPQFARLVLAAAVLSAPLDAAWAQKSNQAAPAQTTTVRYIDIHGELMGDLFVDGFIKETRRGNAVVAAEIDVCHGLSMGSERRDRFAMELRADGNRFAGTGDSLEDKVPVSMQYTRQGTGANIALKGTLKRGATTTNFNLTGLTELTEAQFKENRQREEPRVVAAPTEFGPVLPASLVVIVDRRAVVDIVNDLRSQKVRVVYYGLVQDCDVLRSGRQAVRIDVEPARAASVVAKLRSLPGVKAAGWSEEGVLDWSVRFPAGDWREADGTISRDKAGPRLAALLAKVLSATHAETAWDDATGQAKLRFKRPGDILPALGLTETIAVTALLTPDRPGASDRLLLIVEDLVTDVVDEGAGPRLSLWGAENTGEEGGWSIDPAELAKALAKELGGQTWSNETNSWR